MIETLWEFFLKSLIERNFRIELSSANICDLTNLINSQSGKSIHLKEKVSALRERDKLVICKNLIDKNNTVFLVSADEKIELNGTEFSIEEVNKKMIKFTNNKFSEFISGDGLGKKFEIRRWREGDKFQPIGMKGTKKLSDFLSDVKISSVDKKISMF